MLYLPASLGITTVAIVSRTIERGHTNGNNKLVGSWGITIHAKSDVGHGRQHSFALPQRISEENAFVHFKNRGVHKAVLALSALLPQIYTYTSSLGYLGGCSIQAGRLYLS